MNEIIQAQIEAAATYNHDDDDDASDAGAGAAGGDEGLSNKKVEISLKVAEKKRKRSAFTSYDSDNDDEKPLVSEVEADTHPLTQHTLHSAASSHSTTHVASTTTSTTTKPTDDAAADLLNSLPYSRKDNWLREGIIVKVLNKTLAKGQIYGKKGTVVRVYDDYVGEVLLEGPIRVKIDQEQLQTVLPKVRVCVRVYMSIVYDVFSPTPLIMMYSCCVHVYVYVCI